MKNLRTINYLFTFISALLGVCFVWAEETTVSSCVSCHKQVENVSYLEHNYTDWEKSVHAQAEVSCHVCHGGNPVEASEKKAHEGILPSSNAKSSVYFTRVSETCGACHQNESKAFQKSAHYKELMRSGRGPNCVTCHGSMANHILQPRELEMTCTLCHRRPTQAYAAMLSLNNADTSLQKLSAALEEVEGEKLSTSQQEKRFEQAEKLYQDALIEWHKFDMSGVIKSSQKIIKQVNTALNELRMKEGK